MENKVNLFVVGAAKSGTTSLTDLFEMTNDIFVPQMKEPFYFIDEAIGITKESEYLSLYKNSEKKSVRVDASTGYLFDLNACDSIYKYNPDSKILIVLRNPIDMAFSLWSYMKRNGVEDRSFDKAFFEDAVPAKYSGQGWAKNYLYRERAKYYKQVSRYLNRFESVKVITFEEMVQSSESVLSEILNFLDVDFDGELLLPKSNEAGSVRWTFLKKIRDRRYPLLRKIINPSARAYLRKLTREINTKGSKKECLSIEERAHYISAFEADVNSLKEIGVAVDLWKDFK
ncbi:sulfotransferase domain-containing protein [Marinobacter nitratireducens]|uniref:sulfotransferase domain-containing protein n=1 Tax=Marinobacter nitratireducens TaxID=1137280 RepID=UPI00056872C2|nr:sulfotransferase domain-containing protein [Marinobacter nitratireducens]